jgi:hypothetical protein
MNTEQDSYLPLTKPKRRKKFNSKEDKDEFYLKQALSGIVKPGPKNFRPKIKKEEEENYCKCSTCRILGEFGPKTERISCLDFYGTIERDCDLLIFDNSEEPKALHEPEKQKLLLMCMVRSPNRI